MKVETYCYKLGQGWLNTIQNSSISNDANLVLIFAPRISFEETQILAEIATAFPNALVVGGSTAGEIIDTSVNEQTIIVTAIAFEKTKLIPHVQALSESSESYQTGVNLAESLALNNLRYVMVLSDGLIVNGSELVRGLRESLPIGVTITGALMADDISFSKTYVILNQQCLEKHVLVIGFYSENLEIGYGTMGGWDAYGLVRQITRSDGNILYEMDGKPALSIYKQYLGERAEELPSSGLLFPLSIRLQKNDYPLVRTILGIDEEHQAIIFAGAVPKGAYAQFMKANLNRLVDGASMAATTCCKSFTTADWDYALLISCIGRKLVLKQRVEEEIEAVKQVLGDKTVLSGFYSYGEICPIKEDTRCELHNQSMTITTFLET